jgi:hypothetical protein
MVGPKTIPEPGLEWSMLIFVILFAWKSRILYIFIASFEKSFHFKLDQCQNKENHLRVKEFMIVSTHRLMKVNYYSTDIECLSISPPYSPYNVLVTLYAKGRSLKKAKHLEIHI